MNDIITNDTEYIKRLRKVGAQVAQESTTEPAAQVGMFSDSFPAWEPGTVYEKQYSLFTYDGKVGFTRQANITAMEHQPPFSTGMEVVYGVRPIPESSGVYPYEYNMRVEEGMRVRSARDGYVYICIQPADPLLFDPVDVPAHFELEI